MTLTALALRTTMIIISVCLSTLVSGNVRYDDDDDDGRRYDFPAGRENPFFADYSPYQRQRLAAASNYPNQRQATTKYPYPAASRYSSQTLKINIPGATSDADDRYFCTGRSLSADDGEEQFITDVTPMPDSPAVHHVVLFGCKYASVETELEPLNYWDCGRTFATCGESSMILYSWARNGAAEKLHLPRGVGFRVGGRTDVKFLVVQVHYDRAFAEAPDYSGVSLTITSKPQPNIAGMYILYADDAVVPAKSRNVHVDVVCVYQGRAPLRPLAFRVHTHDLGVSVTAYRVRDGAWTLLGSGDPRRPQSFLPVVVNNNNNGDRGEVDVRPGDYLAARCIYDNPGSDEIKIGGKYGDEMCNFYLMYATLPRGGLSYGQCHKPASPHFAANFPHHDVVADGGGGAPPRSRPLDPRVDDPPAAPAVAATASSPATAIKEETASPSVSSVPTPIFADEIHVRGLGQVGGLATDSVGRLVVFHRASRVWSFDSFNNFNNKFNAKKYGVIRENTLALVDTLNGGAVVREWGRDLFYMPHGLTIDGRGRLWVTDVGAHRVYRFPEMGNETADLVLGVEMIPGNDRDHFCKPTDVAVARDGSFFVADGYCNNRVIRFDDRGRFDRQWGESPAASGAHPPPLAFFVPHGLALAEEKGLLCIADRENGRIQCTDLRGKFKHSVQSPEFNRLFALEYSPVDKVLYAVNGPATLVAGSHVKGFTISISSFEILNSWTRRGKDFDQPHDVTVSPDGRYVYVGEIGPNRVTAFRVVATNVVGRRRVTSGGAGRGGGGGEDLSLALKLDAADDASSSGAGSGGFSLAAASVVVVVGVLFVVGGGAVMGLQRYRGIDLKKVAKFHLSQICYDSGGGGGSGRRLHHRSGSGGGGGGYYPPMGETTTLNLGTLLNRRQGFDRLRTEEGELESLSQDLSDAEEYEATGETTELNT